MHELFEVEEPKQAPHPGFFESHQETKVWLEEQGLGHFKINDDLSVDVFSGVNFQNKNIEFIPVNFRHCWGSFKIINCNTKSLRGTPKAIIGHQKTLKDNEIVLDGGFSSNYNNLKTLEYFPKLIMGNVDIRESRVKTFKGISPNILYSIRIRNNEIVNWDYSPYVPFGIDVARNLICSFRNYPFPAHKHSMLFNNLILYKKEKKNQYPYGHTPSDVLMYDNVNPDVQLNEKINIFMINLKNNTVEADDYKRVFNELIKYHPEFYEELLLRDLVKIPDITEED